MGNELYSSGDFLDSVAFDKEDFASSSATDFVEALSDDFKEEADIESRPYSSESDFPENVFHNLLDYGTLEEELSGNSGNDLQNQEHGPNDSSGETDSIAEEVDIVDFVEMAENTEIGHLAGEDLDIIRDLLSAPLSEGENKESIGLRERVLHRLIDEWLESSSWTDEAAPIEEYFYNCIEGWNAFLSMDNDPFDEDYTIEILHHVSDILIDLEQLYSSTNYDPLKPQVKTLELAFKMFMLAPGRGFDQHAETILQSCIHKHGISPSPSMYEAVIFLLAKVRNRDAAKRSERLLREACNKIGANKLSVDVFNVVLTAWAKNDDTNSPECAEKLLVFMTENDVRPNASSFTCLIDAYGQKTEWKSALVCEGILLRMLGLFLDGDKSLEPNIVSWTVVTSTWARLSRKGSKDAAKKADTLLRNLENLHETGKISYPPDAKIYLTCMNANAFLKTPDSLKRAVEILDEMNELYLDGDESFKPTSRSIHLILDSFVHSELPNKLVEAELLFEKYKSNFLDDLDLEDEINTDRTTQLWRTMVYGWSQTGNPVQAGHYLDEMIDYNLNLDSACFDRVIEANYKTNDARAMIRSYGVFEAMESCRLQGRVKPNERVYTSFIRAMCKAQVPEVASKALSLLERMEDLYHEGNIGIKPSLYTYNSLLLACATAADQPDANDTKVALQIALSTFEILRNGSKGVEPDHVSCGNMIRCANLVPSGGKREAWIASSFKFCCQIGLLNSFVLSDLERVASAETFESLVGAPPETSIAIDDLPANWSRNAKTKRSTTPSKRRKRGFR